MFIHRFLHSVLHRLILSVIHRFIHRVVRRFINRFIHKVHMKSMDALLSACQTCFHNAKASCYAFFDYFYQYRKMTISENIGQPVIWHLL